MTRLTIDEIAKRTGWNRNTIWIRMGRSEFRKFQVPCAHPWMFNATPEFWEVLNSMLIRKGE